MIDELNDRLAIAKARTRQKSKLDAMLRSTTVSLFEAKDSLEQLKDRLSKEQADVDAMEGLSLTGIFYTVLGSKGQRTEKERQELVAAKLKHDQVADTVQQLKEEVMQLSSAAKLLENAEKEYEQVVQEKEQFLAQKDDGMAKKLVELSQQIASLSADRKELSEAVEAGDAALRSLDKVRNTLSSAASWGTVDMFGGGMLATMLKHSEMDTANNEVRVAQRHLVRFEKELAEANERLHVSLELDGFSRFADYFFDGLIMDWIVQSKINKASDQCSEVSSRVRTAIKECKTRLKAVEAEVDSLTEAKHQLVESS